jgi:hypothetical protein
MRTSTRSFTLALVLVTLLTAPVFAARDDAKRQPREQQQQPTIVQRVINHLKHVFDTPILTTPDVPTTTT